MWLSMVLTCLCLCLTPADHQETEHEPLGALIVPAVLFHPSRDTLCIHGLYMKSVTQLTVSILSLNETQTLYPDPPVNSSVYQCMSFQVPAPADGYWELINITLSAIGMGGSNIFYTETNAKVVTISNNTFVQTDQHSYKPGQLVRCRMVKMDPHFNVFNESFGQVTLKDPNNTQIAQWASVPTEQGIGEITFQLDPHCLLGYYELRLDSVASTFTVEDSVLPEIEVIINSPAFILKDDQNFTMQICARYTYGQPVQGTAWHKACQSGNSRNGTLESLCYESSAHTDTSGCLTKMIKTDHFKLTDNSYSSSLDIQASFLEDGTGVKISANSQNILISSWYENLKFKETKPFYRQGVPYTGKVLLKNKNGIPLQNKNVYISENNYPYNITWELTYITDANGEISFSLNTSDWTELFFFLHAREDHYREPDDTDMFYGNDFLSAGRLYSYTNSTISIVPAQGTALCGLVLDVHVDYTVSSEELEKDTQSVTFYYLLLSKDGLIDSGLMIQLVRASDPQGNFLIPVSVDNISPSAQLVVYTITSDGAITADSTTLSVSKCLRHKVFLKFQEDQVVSGTNATLEVKAAPGARCALQVVDETTLAESSQLIDEVPGMSNDRSSYLIEGSDLKPCVNTPSSTTTATTRNPTNGDFGSTTPMYDSYSYGTPYRLYDKDIKSLFKNAGFQLSSNLLIEALECVYPKYPVYKPYTHQPTTDGEWSGTTPLWRTDAYTSVKETQTTATTVVYTSVEEMQTTATTVAYTSVEERPNTAQTSTVMTTATPEKPRRRLFYETWLWDQILLDSSGTKELNVTTPDTIRNWKARMFCIGDIGFGVSQTVSLKTFKPFLAILSMLDSVVQGEHFILQVKIFSYLKHQGMKIMIQLAASDSIQGDTSTYGPDCLYADEPLTYNFNVTATKLGTVNLTVITEAVDATDMCINMTLPDVGRMETVNKTILVTPK